MANASVTMKIEISEEDRDLLRRTNENIEWYRNYVKEQAEERMPFPKDIAREVEDTLSRKYRAARSII